LYAGEDNQPDAAICPRIKTASLKRCGEAGWLHVLRHRDHTPSHNRVRRRTVRSKQAKVSGVDCARLAARYVQALDAPSARHLAASLGVSRDALRRLDAGRADDHNAWSFPMRHPDGSVLGIRLRLPNGSKIAVKGGREGLFLPSNLAIPNDEPLLICEGPSDCAALLDAGFAVASRPSCMGGKPLTVKLVQRLKPAEVVIVADGDRPGQQGAEHLLSAIIPYVTSVRVITPPGEINDVREWRQAGASHQDIAQAIEDAQIRRVHVRKGVRR
jgi:phage/plasmid primase-like uncharacterized protein